MFLYSKLCKPNLLFRFTLSFIISTTIIFSHSTDTKAEVSSNSISITHVHTGNETSGGGCYKTMVSEKKKKEVYCTGVMVFYPEWDTTQCNKCGASYSGDQSWRDCYYYDVIEYEANYWKLSCGMNTKTILGNFSVNTDTDEWSKELHVTCNVTPESLLKGDNPYSVNNNTLEGNEYIITENGDYEFVAKLNQTTSGSKISISVNNIDNTAPVFSVDYDDTPDLPVISVLVDATDYQPDSSNGSGLAEEAFSYDGGVTWSSSNTQEIKDNGEYTICVRDKCDNISSTTITVTNIKKPVIKKQDNNSDNQKPSGDNQNNSSGNDQNISQDENEQNNNDNNISNIEVNDTEIVPEPDVPVPSQIISTPKKAKEPPMPETDNTNKAKEMPATTPTIVKKSDSGIKPEAKQLDTIETLAEPSSKDINTLEDNNKHSLSAVIPAIILLGALGTAGMTGILFALFYTCAIYNYTGKDKYRLKGLGIIKKSNEMYETNIPERISSTCDTGLLVIKPSFAFVLLNKEKDLTVYLHNKQAYPSHIEKNIKITLKSS